MNPANAAPFIVFSALCAFLLAFSVYLSRKRSDQTGFVILPCLCGVLLYENIVISISTSASGEFVRIVKQGRFALDGFIYPMFLVALFELNYEVHKRRSANFFFITFDEGHRSKEGGWYSKMVRYSIWIVSFIMVLLSIVGNSKYIHSPDESVFITRFKSKGVDFGSGNLDHVINYAPILILMSFALYSGLSFWRYGSSISTDVSATACNGWMTVFVADAGLVLVWVFTPTAWQDPFLVNGGLILLATAVVKIAYLVHINLQDLEVMSHSITSINRKYKQEKKSKEQLEALPHQSSFGSASGGGGGAERKSVGGDGYGPGRPPIPDPGAFVVSNPARSIVSTVPYGRKHRRTSLLDRLALAGGTLSPGGSGGDVVNVDGAAAASAQFVGGAGGAPATRQQHNGNSGGNIMFSPGSTPLAAGGLKDSPGGSAAVPSHRVRFSDDTGMLSYALEDDLESASSDATTTTTTTTSAATPAGGTAAAAGGGGGQREGGAGARAPIWSRKDSTVDSLAASRLMRFPTSSDVDEGGGGGGDDASDDDNTTVVAVDTHGKPIAVPKWLEVEAQRVVQGMKPPIWQRPPGSPSLSAAAKPTATATAAATTPTTLRSIVPPTEGDFSEDDDDDNGNGKVGSMTVSIPPFPGTAATVSTTGITLPTRSPAMFSSGSDNRLESVVLPPPHARTPSLGPAVAAATVTLPRGRSPSKPMLLAPTATPAAPTPAPAPSHNASHSNVLSGTSRVRVVTANAPAPVPVLAPSLPPHLRR